MRDTIANWLAVGAGTGTMERRERMQGEQKWQKETETLASNNNDDTY